MALEGSVSTNGYQGRYYYVNWKATQSIPNNGSTISWTLGCAGGTSSWYAERTLVVVINGNTVVSKSDRVQRYAGGITSGSLFVPHNANGDASFGISIQVAVYTSSVNCTGSNSFTLNNIPRKSTLSVSNGTLGVAQTLTVTRKSTSFTHTIKYSCGSYSGTICTKSTSTSISWTPPMDFANGAPNGSSVYISLSIETFNGNTSVGSNSYAINGAIPESVVPTVSFTVADAMGYLATYGKYVQKRSKFQVAITAAGAYSSIITSYSTTIDGKTITDASFTTDVISNSGTLVIETTVTDSRGRTATSSQTVSVFAYDIPKINSFSLKRCDASGEGNATGNYLALVFGSVVTALDAINVANYVVRYKKKNDPSYTAITLSDYANTYVVNNGTYIFAADPGSSYDVLLEVSDAFSSTNRSGEGSSISKLFSWLSKGLGWAFGKVAEIENALEIAWNTYIKGSLYVKGPVMIKGSVDVSGGNLYRGTRDFTGDNWVNAESWWNTGEKYNGFSVFARNGSGQGLCQEVYATAGEVYSFSAYAKVSNAVSDEYIIPDYCGETTDSSALSEKLGSYLGVDDSNFVRVYATWRITRSGILRPGIELTVDTGTIYIAAFKLEKSNVPTDWSLAPEDAALMVDGDGRIGGSFTVDGAMFDRFGLPDTNGLAMFTGSGDSNAIDPNSTLYNLILTDHSNGPDSGSYYIHTMFYSTKSATTNRAQYAFPYSKTAPMYTRYYYDGSWSEWNMHDSVVAEGTSGDWYYRKYASGWAELWAYKVSSLTTIVGQSSTGHVLLHYPFALTSKPKYFASFGVDAQAFCWLTYVGANTESMEAYGKGNGSANGTVCWFSFYVAAKWK